jgi:phosphatidylinositol glycan class Q protein
MNMGMQEGSASIPIAYVQLKVHLLNHVPILSFNISQSVPLPLRAMFNPYFELGARIRKHYFSPSVFLYLVSGQFVPPIHRKNLYSLQYSMLPAERVSITELWEKLTEGVDSKKAHILDGYQVSSRP